MLSDRYDRSQTLKAGGYIYIEGGGAEGLSPIKSVSPRMVVVPPKGRVSGRQRTVGGWRSTVFVATGMVVATGAAAEERERREGGGWLVGGRIRM